MMYRLKKEASKYFTRLEVVEPLQWWLDAGLTQEALEEVEEKVKLCWGNSSEKSIMRHSLKKFTSAERDLMEKALNGELYTYDDICKVAIYAKGADIDFTCSEEEVKRVLLGWRDFSEGVELNSKPYKITNHGE